MCSSDLSGKDTDKFDKVQYSVKDFMPVIDDSCGYIVCNVIDRMETATHTVFLGEVTGGEVFADREAMRSEERRVGEECRSRW